MKRTIGALSKLSGVSIRALHYYDEIGLLHPSEIADSGYRYYDEKAVERLWQILFYRELDFPLSDIAEILASPEFDRARALEEHRTLLLQKRERLDGLITLVSNALKGETAMEFKPFDTSKIDELRDQYAEEAKARWGNTDAYRESARRTATPIASAEKPMKWVSAGSALSTAALTSVTSEVASSPFTASTMSGSASSGSRKKSPESLKFVMTWRSSPLSSPESTAEAGCTSKSTTTSLPPGTLYSP